MIRFDRRLRDALRRETRDILHGGPPTVELLRPVGPDIPSDERVFQVLDLCLQVGEVLLSSGEAAADTSATMTRLAAACGLATVEIDITFTSITMCCRRGKAAAPVTSMRVVRYRTTDLTRLAPVTRIVDQVVRGEMGVAGRRRRAGQGGPCPPSLPALGGHRRLGRAGRRGGVAARRRADDLVDGLRGHRADRPHGPVTRPSGGSRRSSCRCVGGFVATACTLGLLAVGALPSATEPSLVIAASITVLLSGLSLMGAVQDAISGHPVTAAGRAVEIALLSAGLLTGVIVGAEGGYLVRADPRSGRSGGRRRHPVRDLHVRGGGGGRAVRPRRLRAAALSGRRRAGGWDRLGRLRRAHPGSRIRSRGGHRACRRPHRPGERADRPPYEDRPARDRPVRDHPAVARAHRVPRLLPAGLARRTWWTAW